MPFFEDDKEDLEVESSELEIDDTDSDKEDSDFDMDDDLNYWIQLALDFNPKAESSKKVR